MRERWMGSNPVTLPEQYDYVIVGGGTAGCVLANRLSADPAVSVLLLEAGGPDNWIWTKIPVGYLYCIGNSRTDWCYSTAPQRQLDDAVLAYPRGRVLGGSSSINGMIYMRGQSADYDGWAQDVGKAWSWQEMLPLFLELEEHHAGNSEFHNGVGDWRVERQRVRWDILEAVRKAATQAGIPAVDDFNKGDNEGCGYFEVNQRCGRRVNAVDALLKPIAHRHNLSIMTDSVVDRLEIEQDRATAVIVKIAGVAKSIKANREILLAAGAVGSPCILQRSGIGPAAYLQSLGIKVKRDLAVGQNLQDHLQLRPVFRVQNTKTLNTLVRSRWQKILMGLEYGFRRSGPLSMSPSQLGIFTRSARSQDRANLQFHVQPLSLGSFGKDLHDFAGITMSVCNLRPQSRGVVQIGGADVEVAPHIDPNYLHHAEDQQVAVDSLRLARHIVGQSAMSAFQILEELPGSKCITDEQLLDRCVSLSSSIFHPVGTCRMGRGEDAVVDPELKVIGITGLRVIDASIMPTITSGNTNSPTAAIALNGAKLIAADGGLKIGPGVFHPFDLFRTAIPNW